jgi:hypothetical protein
MSTTFSAKEPALGYYYQIIRGLVLLLDEDGMESSSLSFECLDDISIENEEETDLYQLKLHVSTAQLTDRSADFWKTIRVWSEGIADGTFIPERTIFTLITTASRSADTFINKFESNDKKDLETILTSMESISLEENNSTNEKGYSAFKALSVEQKKMLIRNIRIADADLSINDTWDALRKQLELSAPSKFLDPFIEGVVGWWFIETVKMLASKTNNPISRESVKNQINTLRDQLREDALPDDFFSDDNVSDSELKENQSENYIKQLSLIDATDREKRAAIIDYQRAYGQRSKWLRDGRVTQEDYDKFDTDLRYDWKSRFELMQDESEEKLEEERKQAGHVFYRDFYVNPKHTMPSFKNKGLYISKGSYQMLSDKKEVGWHPDYKEKLSDDETVE